MHDKNMERKQLKLISKNFSSGYTVEKKLVNFFFFYLLARDFYSRVR